MSGLAVSDVGAGLSEAQWRTQYQVAALKKQKEAMQAEGNAVVQLIQAAMIMDPDVGRNLEVTA